MAQDTTPAIIVYQGDGSNTVFSVPFDKGYYGEVKVLFVRRGLADYTYYPNTYTVSGRLYAWAKNTVTNYYTTTPNPGIGTHTYNASGTQLAYDVTAIAGQTITVNGSVCTRAVQHDLQSNLLLTWTGATLQVGDFICIIRETERGQPYVMPNNQKHIENALDNLERQIQEVKDATDNALIVDPSHTIPDSHKMNPVDWMKSIVRCMDFSVRALRYNNGWLDYSLDDPNISDSGKSWHHLLNTENIKSVREVKRTIDNVEHRWLEYLSNDGAWRSFPDCDYINNQNPAPGAIDPLYDWVGTEAEYYEQDVAGQHPDWICFILDDNKDILTEYITVDYVPATERLVITSGGTGVGTKITQAHYSNTYTRLILS